ncbi:MAG: hypothetical protein H6624_04015 [Bdellovibrionaceae bacterium]|nr:hypothetical protein [Bdellovibrionales bacterium]MCB9083480.1 hypothetical protein [Pseudobdellovibrionaceae bacterium]
MQATKKVLSLFVGAAVATGLSFAAYAEEQESSSETKVKMEEAKGEAGEGDVDELITNRKLRAETGSKSKLSVSTSFNYSGATINKPGARIRPNIRGAANTVALASLSGSIAGKYRLGTKDSVSAGVGLRMLTPFHDSLNTSKINGVERADVYNPYVDLTHIDKIGGFQSVTSASVTGMTTDYSRQTGYVANISVSETLLKDIGTSGFSVGLYSGIDGSIFDKFDDAAKAGSADYSIGFYPFLEYVINDTLNFRTISGLWVYDHLRSERSTFTFEKNKIYQSVGLGISVSRDIYLYPNVQFLPENIRADLTNVALSANINVF